MKRHETMMNKIERSFTFSKKEIGIFFMGVGLTMFLLNLITMANSMYILVKFGTAIEYPFTAFYVSMFSSVFLTIYAIFNLTSKE